MQPLGDGFAVELREAFSVRVFRWPESVQLQLFQRGLLGDTMLAAVYLAVPGAAQAPHPLRLSCALWLVVTYYNRFSVI